MQVPTTTITLLFLLGCGKISAPPVTSSNRDSTPPTANPSPDSDMKKYEFNGVHIGILREADKKKYPLPVGESYSLTKEAVLEYSAYFHNMPIQMNHNDSIPWEAGEHGKKVIELLGALVNSPQIAELSPRSDEDGQCEDGHYSISLTHENSDKSFCLNVHSKGAYEPFHLAFADMLKAFESDTGRPLDPFKLPQSPSSER